MDTSESLYMCTCFLSQIFLDCISIILFSILYSNHFSLIALSVKTNYLFFSASSGRWGCTCICLAMWSSSTSTASPKFKPSSQYWRLSWPPPSGPCLDQHEEDPNIISMVMVIHHYQHHRCSSSHNSLRGIHSTHKLRPTFCSEAHQHIPIAFYPSLTIYIGIHATVQALQVNS